jgi:glutathione S-transferase
MSLILHHYPLSPFSEKIRSMLGYAGVEWTSCITSEAPPRGKLDFLSGGYNRIPVAQVGSDIFCDSNIIADEIASLSSKPELANAKLNKGDLAQRQWLESKLFFACVNRAFSPSLLGRIAKEKGLGNLARFLRDRIEMSMKASISMGSPKSAPKHIADGFSFLLEHLEENKFVGGEVPNLLDFSAYHCFWFLREVGAKNDMGKNADVLKWYLRLKAFTNAPVQEFEIEQALKTARSSEPRKINKRDIQDHRIGSEIVISPNDYRQVPVSGTLVGANKQRWIIARNTPETGLIHLHFPTNGVDVNIRLASQ